MRSPALLLLLTAACYRSSDAPPASPAPTAPAGPPPTLKWAAGFETTRLPAVSADGASILLGIEANDGGRGNANFRFELRDRSDAKLVDHSVLTVDEYDEIQGTDGKLRGMDARIAEANRWLAAQNAERRFVPLTELPVETGDEIATPFRATMTSPTTGPTGGGVTLEWRTNDLKVTEGGKPIVTRDTPPEWGDQRRPSGGPGETCENPAFLGQAWISLPHKLAVISVSYSGNDLCWEPSNAPHVIAW